MSTCTRDAMLCHATAYHACVYLCVCVRARACACMRTYRYSYACCVADIQTYTDRLAYIYIYIYIYILCTCIQTRVRFHVSPCTRICTFICTCVHSAMHTLPLFTRAALSFMQHCCCFHRLLRRTAKIHVLCFLCVVFVGACACIHTVCACLACPPFTHLLESRDSWVSVV
jgi:hypothetical protein